MTEAADDSAAEPIPPHVSLPRLFAMFLARGAQAFGGPVVQIASLRADLVDRDRWASDARFRRALAVYQALPGPEATELCCWFGYLARGRLGAFVAGLGFVLPGFLCVLGLAWAYREHGLTNEVVRAAFAGVQPAVLALVVCAVPRLAKGAFQRRGAVEAFLVGAIGEGLGVPFALPLAAGALFVARSDRRRVLRAIAAGGFAAWAWFGWGRGPGDVAGASPGEGVALAGVASPLDLLRSGLEAGLLTFGGAYTAIPFVRDDAVVVHGWLSDGQFLDAIALVGVLPAPLLMFTTFVGHLAGGLAGAIAMTCGVFAPAFSFTVLGHRFLERLGSAQRLHAVLDGIAASVVGLVAATAVRLCFVHLRDASSFVAFALSLATVTLLRVRFAPLLVVGVGAVVGLSAR